MTAPQHKYYTDWFPLSVGASLAADPGVILCPAVPLAAPAVTLMEGAPAAPRSRPFKPLHLIKGNP